MPRDGQGISSPPLGTKAVSGTTISSDAFNDYVDDQTNLANEKRPVTAGGTGGATTAEAQKNLDIFRKSGDTLTGALSYDPGTLDVLTGGTKAVSYTAGNRRRFELRSGTNVLSFSDIPESGGDLEIDLLYTAGTLTFAQSIRWKIGGGDESLTFADTGVVLTAGTRYALIVWNMGSTIYGVIG